MRTSLTRSIAVTAASALALLATAGPALAQEAEGSARPWHYWIAPFLLGGAVLLVAALGVGYYVRVVGGRRR